MKDEGIHTNTTFDVPLLKPPHFVYVIEPNLVALIFGLMPPSLGRFLCTFFQFVRIEFLPVLSLVWPFLGFPEVSK